MNSSLRGFGSILHAEPPTRARVGKKTATQPAVGNMVADLIPERLSTSLNRRSTSSKASSRLRLSTGNRHSYPNHPIHLARPTLFGNALALRERPAYGETLSSIESNKRVKKWVHVIMGLLFIQALCLGVNCELIWDNDTNSFTTNLGSQICKIIFSISTIAMVVLVYKIRMHEREEALMFGIELEEGGPKFIYLELFFLCLHVPPFLNTAFACGSSADGFCVEDWVDTFNLWCLYRAYLIVEYYKINHTCWIQREALQEVLKNSEGDPVLINSSYVVRAGLLEEPWSIAGHSFVVLLLVFCYWIYIAERAVTTKRYDEDLPPMALLDTVYYILIVFTGVGLGDLYCITQLGRAVTVLIAGIGVAFTAVVLSTLMSWVRMQEEEIAAASVADYLHTRQQVREEAAVMIQRWWRKVRDDLDSGDLENRKKILSDSNFGVKPGSSLPRGSAVLPPKTHAPARPRQSYAPVVEELSPTKEESKTAPSQSEVSQLRDDVKRLEELMLLLLSKVDGKTEAPFLPASVPSPEQ